MDCLKPKKKVLHISGDRTNGGIDPTFGVVMVALMWFGTFAIASLAENVSPVARYLYPSVMAILILIPGLYLFQSYELDITTDYVIWQTSIIPLVWMYKWKEPMTNYCEIVLLCSMPVSWGIKYNPDKIVYPVRISSSHMSEADHEFNRKLYAIIILKHRSDSKKSVSLKCFEWEQTEKWQAAASQFGKDFNLSVSISKK